MSWFSNTIPCKNLRIALIDEVYSNWSEADILYGMADEYEIFRQEHGGPSIESLREYDDPELVPQLEKFILNLSVSKSDLLSLESIELDGDRDAYHYIFPYWWDLGNHFEITNLKGLELCRNLGEIRLGQGIVQDASLAPLVNLSKLTYISLCYTGNYRDISSLMKMNLQKCWISNIPVSPDNDWIETIKVLKAKGVEI